MILGSTLLQNPLFIAFGVSDGQGECRGADKAALDARPLEEQGGKGYPLELGYGR